MRYMLIFLFILGPCSINAEVVKLWPISKTTPNHVYPIWVNINKLLITIGEKEIANWSAIASKEGLKSEIFKDKSPRDVLIHLSIFRKKLNKLLIKNKLSKTDESHVSRGQKMDPYTVFFNSLHILDSIVEWESKKYGHINSSAKYFHLKIVEDKVPSNVFSLVEKAIKRIEIIRNKQ